MRKVKIADKLVGEGEPCFIIAEAGVNHNGDVTMAEKLIDAAKDAGADAVKFQTFKAENVVTRDAEKASYQKETTHRDESQYEMIKKLELTNRDFEELFAYAQKKGIIFLSSPFDEESVNLLDKLGVPAFKLASGEITNFPLIKQIAEKGKPIVLSTGMSTLAEIDEALQFITGEGIGDIVLLHCITSYPAKVEVMNLKSMETLRHVFKLPVGLSDHTIGITIPIAAVALGACVIEKHFTLDRKLPGPDHRASLEPAKLRQMIKAIRDVESAMGDGIKKPSEQEEEIKKVTRRSIVALTDIPSGVVITKDMIGIKRPGSGIEPRYLHEVVGSISKTRIERDETVTRDKLKE